MEKKKKSLGLKILLGCLASPFVLVLVLGILVLAFRLNPIPQSETASAESIEPSGGITPEQLAAEGLTLGGGGPADRAVPVSIRLEEGDFRVKPGPPGSAIRVEGDYDKALYELKLEGSRDSSGRPSYSVTFLPKYSKMRRLLSQGFLDMEEGLNNITVYIPRDVPIDLNAQVQKGASRFYLGGLAIREARLDLKMGEHRLYVDEPNPIEMTSLEIHAGMGEIRMQKLGNFRAGDVIVWAKMGEISLDMGPEIRRDTELRTRMKMGEMRLSLPMRARVKANTSVWFAESSGNTRSHRYDSDPNLPVLTVDAGITFGELSYRRH